jgi:tetratricopeptide (TPR) repeat protein
LAIFAEIGDPWGQLQAIEWLGAFEEATGDYRQASRLHRDGLRIAEDLSLWPQAADALSWLGRSAMRSGDLAQARELFERAVRLATRQSYLPGQVFAEIGLGLTARAEGKLDIAEDHMRNVLRSSRRIGSGPDTAHAISSSELGFIAEQRGDPATAIGWHLECLDVARKLGDPRAIAQALCGLAGALAIAGQPDRAAQLLGAADTARSPVGAGMPREETGDVGRITAAARRALGEVTFAAEFRKGRELDPERAPALLGDLSGRTDS